MWNSRWGIPRDSDEVRLIRLVILRVFSGNTYWHNFGIKTLDSHMVGECGNNLDYKHVLLYVFLIEIVGPDSFDLLFLGSSCTNSWETEKNFFPKLFYFHAHFWSLFPFTFSPLDLFTWVRERAEKQQINWIWPRDFYNCFGWEISKAIIVSCSCCADHSAIF